VCRPIASNPANAIVAVTDIQETEVYSQWDAEEGRGKRVGGDEVKLNVAGERELPEINWAGAKTWL
jgi:hypothetical protein